MARLPRHISKFVRAKSLAVFRESILPIIRQRTLTSMRSGSKPSVFTPWAAFPVSFPLGELRDGVEALLEVPAAAASQPQSRVERLEAELKLWKRNRTTARRKVAQLQRQVRYHRLKQKSGGTAE